MCVCQAVQQGHLPDRLSICQPVPCILSERGTESWQNGHQTCEQMQAVCCFARSAHHAGSFAASAARSARIPCNTCLLLLPTPVPDRCSTRRLGRAALAVPKPLPWRRLRHSFAALCAITSISAELRPDRASCPLPESLSTVLDAAVPGLACQVRCRRCAGCGPTSRANASPGFGCSTPHSS